MTRKNSVLVGLACLCLGALSSQVTKRFTESEVVTPSVSRAALRPPQIRRASSPVPKPESAPKRIARDVIQFEETLAKQVFDPTATTALRTTLQGAFKTSELSRLTLKQLKCFETLCKLTLQAAELKHRDRDLHLALKSLEQAYFAHVPNAESLIAEIYIARAGHPLLTPKARLHL